MRKMKDSGIAWIGEIPAEWERHRIKNHFSIIAGSGFKPELQGNSTGVYPVCKASDISNAGQFLTGAANYISDDVAHKEHFSIIPKNSVLFPKIGEAMRKNSRTVCMVDCCADNNCQALVPKHIQTNFSYYLLSCIDMDWFDNKGTIPSINNQKLNALSIPYPPFDEQHRIAAFLDEKCAHIDAVIEKTRASIDEYKKLKQAVITRAVTKGIRQGRKMKDSGIEWIGEIPEEWKVHLLKYSIRWKSEKSHGNDEVLSLYREYGVIPKNSRDDNHNVTSLDTSNYKYVEAGDLVINKMKAWQGSIAVSGYQGIVSPAYHVCQITDKRIYQQYLHYLLRNTLYFPEYRRLSTGMRIGQWDLGFDDFKNLPFLLPPLSEQQEIASYLDAKTAAIDRLIAKKEQLVAEMESCKKSLIYEVVTGKREVPISKNPAAACSDRLDASY